MRASARSSRNSSSGVFRVSQARAAGLRHGERHLTEAPLMASMTATRLAPIGRAVEGYLALQLAVHVDHALAVHHPELPGERFLQQGQVDGEPHGCRGTLLFRSYQLPRLEVNLAVHGQPRGALFDAG